MSQPDLAKRVGVSRAAVTKWETGEIPNLRRAHLTAISSIFHVSLEELLNGPAETGRALNAESPRAEYNASDQPSGIDPILDVVLLMRKMDSRKQAIIATFARILSEKELRL